MKILAQVCAVAALVAVTACGGHKTTYSANGTTVTTDEANKTTTVTTGQGSTTVGTGAVDTSKLGVPMYPGATTAGNGEISTQTGQGTGEMVTFKTVDDFSKVEAYYKSRLPAGAEKINMTLNDGSMAEFQIGDQTTALMTVVTVTGKQGETDILVSSRTKSGAATSAESPAPSPESSPGG
jgi:hypothetical protein